MTWFSTAINVATKVAAEKAATLPVTGAGTLSTQVQIFGFGADAIGTTARYECYDEKFSTY